MPETKFQKIDFNWKNKLPFITVYFISLILIIHDTKEVPIKLELGIANGLPIYVTIAGLIVIGVYSGIYRLILKSNSVWGYNAIRHMVIDFKDNITALLIVNVFLAIDLVRVLKQHFNIANSSLVLFLYFTLFYMPLILTELIVVIHNGLIDLKGSGKQNDVIKIDVKEITRKRNYFHKQLWLIPTVTMFILWLAIGVFLLKIDDDNLFSDWINSAVAIGTIAVAIFAWMAYKGYWKQKKEATIYDRIIRSTSLMHTRILQFQKFIDSYSFNTTTLHLNGAKQTSIPVAWLNDLIHDTNTCLSEIKDFRGVISEWKAELDYIHLFSESIKKELITNEIKLQFNELWTDLHDLFRQISKIKDRLLKYSKDAQQQSLTEVTLEVKPIVIKNISIKSTEIAIKDFIKQAISKFS